jgi:hypothetical protein
LTFPLPVPFNRQPLTSEARQKRPSELATGSKSGWGAAFAARHASARIITVFFIFVFFILVTQNQLERPIEYCSQIFIANIAHKSQTSIAEEWMSSYLYWCQWWHL